jgi:hypothetical protein
MGFIIINIKLLKARIFFYFLNFYIFLYEKKYFIYINYKLVKFIIHWVK